jgi:hypothetical protein
MHLWSFLAGMAAMFLWLLGSICCVALWAKRTEPTGEPWSGGVLHDKFGDK